MKKLLSMAVPALLVPLTLAAPAQAAQPERVQLHVEANHGGAIYGPSGNERASLGAGWFFLKDTKCWIYVLNPSGEPAADCLRFI